MRGSITGHAERGQCEAQSVPRAQLANTRSLQATARTASALCTGTLLRLAVIRDDEQHAKRARDHEDSETSEGGRELLNRRLTAGQL